MIAGDGGAPAVKSRTGRSRRWARGWLASMVSTVGAAVEQRVELRGDGDAAHRRRDAGELGRELGRVEDPARPGVVDDVGDVVGGEPGVDGYEDPARLGDAEVGEEERLAVEGEE